MILLKWFLFLWKYCSLLAWWVLLTCQVDIILLSSF